MTKEILLNIAEKKLLTVTTRPDIVFTKGKGMYLWDTEGKKYLDFIAGWAVNSLGHSPNALSKALFKQAKTLVNSSPAFYNSPMLEYADMLTGISCFERVFFCSTGAEANEGAIKLARKYGAKNKNGASDIITTWGSFHGRTLTTMAASGKKQFEKLFEPKTPGFKKADFNDLKAVKKLITKNTCAIIIEPIQGEGGVNVAETEFITGIRDICASKKILMIFDEIQTGMGRTGKMFCYQHYGIEPDIMTLAKGIGGGYPLAAMLAKDELNIFDPGDQGGTYTGQPLAMTAGKAVLEELLKKKILQNCSEMSGLIFDGLKQLSENYEIENIRGKGLLIAFDLMKTKGADLVKKCMTDGLLINSPQEKAIRLMPALTIGRKDIDIFFKILKSNLALK
jgi:acetylornithine/N-succinyldiaminopimelate aminotransferase